jgi:hypothetical protein
MDREVLLVITDKQFKQIMDRLDSMYQVLQELKSGQPAIAGYLDQQNMEKSTGLSRGTLYKMRKQGIIRATKLGAGKNLFYNLEDVQRALLNNEIPK